MEVKSNAKKSNITQEPEMLGKLKVVKQEMAKVNVNILVTDELKWTGMCEFNTDDRYIYYYG